MLLQCEFFNIIITIIIWPHNIYQQSDVYSISWKVDRVAWIGVKYLLSHDFLPSKVDHEDHPFCQHQSENRPLACYSLHFRDDQKLIMRTTHFVNINPRIDHWLVIRSTLEMIKSWSWGPPILSISIGE